MSRSHIRKGCVLLCSSPEISQSLGHPWDRRPGELGDPLRSGPWALTCDALPHTVGAGPRQGHLCPGGLCYTPQQAGWSPPSGLLAGDTTLAQHCFSDPEMARDQPVSSGGDQEAGAHVWTAGFMAKRWLSYGEAEAPTRSFTSANPGRLVWCVGK